MRPGDPPADMIIHLQDAPITLRYKLESPSFHAPTAADLARGTAERYAQWRAQQAVGVDFANPTWLAAWGVEAAIVCAYEVAGPQGAPPIREDLFVLVRQGAILLVTWTYPKGFVDDPAYATFASIAEATMVWDPARWEQTGRVWPDSAFLGPGLYGALKPKHNEAARSLAQLAFGNEERAHLFSILSGVVSSAGAPWVALSPDVREAHRRVIIGAIREPRVRATIETAFVDVHTGHDLRGLAIMLGRALEPRRISSSVPPPLPPPASRRGPRLSAS